jgi:hypothetical protein
MWRRSILYVLLLAVTLFALEMTVLAAAELAYPGGHPDPFAPLEAMMPGQSIDTSAFSLCLFRELRLGRDRRGYCQSSPDDGLSLSMMVSAQTDVIQALSFSGGHFRFGDLVRRWGYPSAITDQGVSENGSRKYLARWTSGAYAVLTPIEPGRLLNYFTLVESLAI